QSNRVKDDPAFKASCQTNRGGAVTDPDVQPTSSNNRGSIEKKSSIQYYTVQVISYLSSFLHSIDILRSVDLQ
ncbi:MAG: hypothetical protein OXF84_10520, partial [Bacteroidetes bacterium]|nr:hypothetical protein [Bacteroidota bacterium]